MAASTHDDVIQLRTEGSVVVASFVKGSFQDEKQILAILERLGTVIDARENVRMVLDMERIEYLSSAGLGRLVSLLKKAMAGGGCLYLARTKPQIKELFDVMRLTQIFKIFDEIEDGVAAYEK